MRPFTGIQLGSIIVAFMRKNSKLLRNDFAENDEATVAIEFVIVAPIALMCIFGIICFGIYFGSVHAVQQLAAEAARASISGLDNTDRKAIAASRVKQDAASYPFLVPKNLTVTAADTDPLTDAFTVTLTYDASALPIFSLPYVPLPAEVISRSATVQRGGF